MAGSLPMAGGGLRILILSELNNPEWISVPLVGFNHAAALGRLHEVHLVTHRRNREGHERHPGHFASVSYFDLGLVDRFYDWVFAKVFKGDFGSQALTAFRVPFYLLFELKVWWAFRRALQNGEFDCVLRLTPVAPVLASPFAYLLKKKVPFVLGPINGGLPFPPGYEQAERQKEWISTLRRFYRHLPFAGSTYRDSDAVISGSSQTATEIDTPRERVFLIPENGINETMIVERVFTEEEKPLELLFVGRLVPYKACDMAIEAAAPLLRDGRARFSIVGDGDERAALEALVERLGLQDRVRFFGMISHSETVEKFREADVLLFPSVREFGGGVVFEALATGTVPVVADYGGPGDIVEPEFGYKVQLSGESATKAQLTEILEALERDREHLRALSRAGQVHARKSLTWDGKAALTTEILEWVTGRAKKPSHLLADDQLAASRTRSVAPVEGESSATGLFSAS